MFLPRLLSIQVLIFSNLPSLAIITQSTLAEDDTRTETIPMDGEDTEAGTDWDGDSDYQSAYSIELYSVHSEGGPPAERLEHLVMHTGGLFGM